MYDSTKGSQPSAALVVEGDAIDKLRLRALDDLPGPESRHFWLLRALRQTRHAKAIYHGTREGRLTAPGGRGQLNPSDTPLIFDPYFSLCFTMKGTGYATKDRVGWRVLGYAALELGCQPSEPSDVVSPAVRLCH